jgi:hypothetical protein
MVRGSIDSSLFLQMLLMRQGLGRVESVATSPVGVLVRPVGTIVALADGSTAWINVDGTISGWVSLSSLAAAGRAWEAGHRGFSRIADITIGEGGEQNLDVDFASAGYSHLEIVWNCDVLANAVITLQPDGVDTGCLGWYWGNNGSLYAPVIDPSETPYAIFALLGAAPSGGRLSATFCERWWFEAQVFKTGNDAFFHQKRHGYMPAWANKLTIASLVDPMPEGTRIKIYGVPTPEVEVIE